MNPGRIVYEGVMDIVILAAGRGSRMRSTTPKVLHTLGNIPVIEHVLRLAGELCPEHVVIVVNALTSDAITALAEKHNLNFKSVLQGEVTGTGGAVCSALKELQGSSEEVLLILYGDTPLLSTVTMHRVLDKLHGGVGIVLVAFESSNSQYGRIVPNESGGVLRIGNEHGINGLAVSGAIAGRKQVISELLCGLPRAEGGELYLTDIVQSAVGKGIEVDHVVTDEQEAMGINTREDLAVAASRFQRMRRAHFLRSGVTLVLPDQVFFSADTQIAQDVIVHPYVVFGLGVAIESGAEILPYSHLEFCRVKERALVGPFARVRGHSVIDRHCIVGNFVEVKESHLGEMSKVKHLSYLGNSTIGSKTNVGAGAVVCNYDGRNKHHSNIGSDCLVGANSTIISPVDIGDNSTVAAGSVITEDLPPHSLGIARSSQITKPGYKPK
ncbi:bifunctional UDP-N-acetylglucosamine diphosphorylase/glucosamine-1-phosphate N-acetyltransferase GlmU [Anaplasma capra]|uniref:bifunctional UDP-N-acetylglucosamine diphosphorylase/glucosamine-1-phosphate N-acetyltransferase GlmU n=1 Tax=Anaplasma capra TaxID=1562740 RepID=UPI0021D574A9|nr:bifunctional UDP-N-acetylglucosamine diphosphorylase/glucosamine-1-phosphate N-acetyltransferase GlmU [Anaplasma capra]